MTFVQPSGWEFVLLALAAYRVSRLIGWDDITKGLRQRLSVKVVGEVFSDVSPVEATARRHVVIGGKTRVVKPRSNWLTKLISCPWCLGWWVSVLWWLAWWGWPDQTLWAATPWALAGIVGLVSRNLDP